MSAKLALKLPPLTLAYILLGLGGLVAFIFLAILPRQAQLTGLDQEIRDLRARMEEQKILLPLADNLGERSWYQEPVGLSLPPAVKLSPAEIAQVPAVFREIAFENNLTIDEVSPDLTSLIQDSAQWRMNLAVNGSFMDFRNFFLRVCEIPYLDKIEEMMLQTIPGSELMILKLKVCLAREV